MSEVFQNKKRNHFQYWLEGLKAKYEGQGRPYGQVEFDKLLGAYDVCRPLITLCSSLRSF